ncbi:PEP-CTERM sorting domain-containing protein [Phycisphaerales bacterium AB-hyl4]|uniref:PEP-CTERM sorting domain-containing protein n=1 Tax=Natronomicrosphaera hydrolytica TaxID=3242702 RepID=A0ABV4U3Q6_9BACT
MFSLTNRSGVLMGMAMCAVVSLAVGSVSATIIPFEDNFETGGDFDSDNIPNFWTWQNNLGGNPTREMFTEDGRLVAQIQGQSSGAGVAGVLARSNAPLFNFLDQTLVYQIDGMSFSGSVNSSGQVLRAGFQSGTEDVWTSRNGIAFQIRANGEYILGWGVDASTRVWDENNLAAGQIDGTPHTLELTVGPNEWAFRLVSDEETLDVGGTVDFANAGFANNGDVYLIYEPFKGTSGWNQFELSVDRIAVVPEPASLGLLGLGGLLMFGRRRR